MNNFEFRSQVLDARFVTNEPYVQAPPFFDSIARAVLASLEGNYVEADSDETTCLGEIDQDRLSSLESLCSPEWYQGVFLTPSKLSEVDFEILHSVFQRGCFLEPFEVDRFEFEVIMNGGQELVDRLTKSSPSGLELKRRFPKEFKGDVQHLREILGVIPENGLLDLTTGIPEDIPKVVVYKVLRWIQAFPPLHREIVNGSTMICAVENCPNGAVRIPGNGFHSQGIEVVDVEGFENSSDIVSIPTGTPLQEARTARREGLKFRVLANGKVVQEGIEPKLDVNFACKQLVIESENSHLEIVRHVKSLERPYGSIELALDGGALNKLDTQLSRAWWFAEHKLLVFVTQADQVFSFTNGHLSHLGAISFSNYGIECAVNGDASRIVISSLGPDFIDFYQGISKSSSRITLGEVPHGMWEEILAKQYKPNVLGFQKASNRNLPAPLLETPLAHVRWFEYKQERALLKSGIETVGQLFAKTKDEAKEMGKLRVRDLDQIEWNIESFLNDKLQSDESGELRERIWLDLESRGWVGELGANSRYELPTIRNRKLLASVRLENQITGTYFDGPNLILKLASGLDVSLNSDYETQLIYVRPWTPNGFLQRRFNLSNRWENLG